MKIKLYESWGVLAHEKQPVYTFNCPVSDAYNLVEVELPHVTGANDYGELIPISPQPLNDSKSIGSR